MAAAAAGAECFSANSAEADRTGGAAAAAGTDAGSETPLLTAPEELNLPSSPPAQRAREAPGK